jgi:hypothetical protein
MTGFIVQLQFLAHTLVSNRYKWGIITYSRELAITKTAISEYMRKI